MMQELYKMCLNGSIPLHVRWQALRLMQTNKGGNKMMISDELLEALGEVYTNGEERNETFVDFAESFVEKLNAGHIILSEKVERCRIS